MSDMLIIGSMKLMNVVVVMLMLIMLYVLATVLMGRYDLLIIGVNKWDLRMMVITQVGIVMIMGAWIIYSNHKLIVKGK